ncbi:MAG: SDR family NAD(P)-dependent oxidoreductase [Solirubrobacteraceae bacterium]
MPSLPGAVGGVLRTIAKPLDAGLRATRPIGASGRYRPLYPLNVVDRVVNGERTLSKAVAGKVVMVTGASSGIGEAAAVQIASAGGIVLLVARGREKLEGLQREIAAAGGVAHVHPCDLTDFEAIDALAGGVLERHGRVDVLVNNAGRSIRRSVELSYHRFHDYERTMQLNYFAPVRLILRFLPGMRERRSGQIVNMSSAGVQTRTPRFGAYIASKAALDTLCDALQAEVHDDGVRFTTIYMSLVRTPMIAPTTIYERFPTLTPEQAAEVVSNAITFRPRRLSPPFGSLASVADALSPTIMDSVRSQGFKLFPDSKSAGGGAADGDSDAPASAVGRAFAQLTRGVHW